MKSSIPDAYLLYFVLIVLILSAVLIILHNSKFGPRLYMPFRLFAKSPAQKKINDKGPRVLYADEGRSGYVIYESEETRFQLYREFGGGDGVVACIQIPGEKEWAKITGLPTERRAEVLDFIGREVVARQTVGGKGSFKMEAGWMVIYGDDMI